MGCWKYTPHHIALYVPASQTKGLTGNFLNPTKQSVFKRIRCDFGSWQVLVDVFLGGFWGTSEFDFCSFGAGAEKGFYWIFGKDAKDFNGYCKIFHKYPRKK